MDTLNITVKNDSLLSIQNKTVQHTTIETIKYKDCKDCWKNMCDCKLVIALIWPITILIILTLFYKRVKFLIDNISERIKKGDILKIGPNGVEIRPAEQTRAEVDKKAEDAFEEVRELEKEKHDPIPVGTIVKKEMYVTKYLQLEREFFEILMKYFYPNFRILSNRRLEAFE